MNRNITLPILPLFVCLALLGGLFALFWYGNPNSVQAQDSATAPAAPAVTLGSAFTYQGYLQQGGTPVDGVACDFYFALWTEITGGTQYGTQTINGVNVNEGVFTVQIDIGNVFTGDGVWLETAVQCPGDGGFTTLTPRQPITATPYALGLQPGAVIYSAEPVGLSVNANDAPGQIALYAEAYQDDSVAVYGSSVNNTAVFGNSFVGKAVWGESSYDNGVYGSSAASNVAGVYGINQAASGIGVRGQADASGGVGVFGSSTANTGVYGYSGASNQAGVYGYNGVSSGIGVKGEAPQSGGVGVYGSSVLNTAVYGTSTSGNGVWGNSSNKYGVIGESHVGTYAGVYGINGSTNGRGVIGQANGSGGIGVYGSSSSSTGVYGASTNGNGVWGVSTSQVGVYGSNDGSNTVGWAGYFDGRLTVNGNLSKAGEAWVSLPNYFEALNRDFRYQLTAVGAPGPNLFIAEMVKDNQFKIAGGTSGMTVSWQITGIRHDPWADANRIEVELPKDEADQGLYLHPEAYGHPREDGIAAQFDAGRPTINDQQLAIDN